MNWLAALLLMPSMTGTSVINFEMSDPGSAMKCFTTTQTGPGKPGAWGIRQDNSSPGGANVIVQSDEDPTRNRFPLCIYDPMIAADVEVSVLFKPISGKVDQAAGVVWRYQDAQNYYIVRANALEQNVVMYKVENGQRTDLKIKAGDSNYGLKAEVPSGKWSTLRVKAIGPDFTVWLNDKQLFEVEDKTFSKAGKIGLWTKADSVTMFDRLEIKLHEDQGK